MNYNQIPPAYIIEQIQNNQKIPRERLFIPLEYNIFPKNEEEPESLEEEEYKITIYI